ncbi:MAG: HD domain-containing protein [Patescibacteria group bacterium]|nr:HD domain-containing protein [Patescibacteria group bacterium]
MQDVNQIYEEAFKLVDKHCSTDATHQQDHIKRVLNLIEYLADKEKVSEQLDWESLRLAAIFHDLGSGYRIKELKKSSDKFKAGKHAQRSFMIAKKFLKQEEISQKQAEKIQKIISSHGVDGLSESIEGHLLHDADLLDGLGLVGVLRIFTFGGQIGRNILGSLEFTKLKINNREFKTKTGKKLGQKRIKKILNQLQKTEEELNGNDL